MVCDMGWLLFLFWLWFENEAHTTAKKDVLNEINKQLASVFVICRMCARARAYTHPFLFKNNKIESNERNDKKTYVQIHTCAQRLTFQPIDYYAKISSISNLDGIFLIFSVYTTAFFWCVKLQMDTRTLVADQSGELAMNWTSDTAVAHT